MKSLKTAFVENVTAAIKRKQLTHVVVAQRMGVSKQLVSTYLQSHREPGLTMVERFAAALGVSPLDLLKQPRKKAESSC